MNLNSVNLEVVNNVYYQVSKHEEYDQAVEGIQHRVCEQVTDRVHSVVWEQVEDDTDEP